jgi:hypothetical protein
MLCRIELRRQWWSSEHVKSVGTVEKVVCWTGICQLATVFEVAKVRQLFCENTIVKPI